MGTKKFSPLSLKPQEKDQRVAPKCKAESEPESDPEFVNNAPYVYERKTKGRRGKTSASGERPRIQPGETKMRIPGEQSVY